MKEKTEMLMTDRREKTVTIETLDITDFDRSLDEVIEMLQNLKNDDHTNYRMEAETDFNYNDGYAQLSVYADRMETDKEMNARIDMHNKNELQKFLREQEAERKEKELFESLKQKYEK